VNGGRYLEMLRMDLPEIFVEGGGKGRSLNYVEVFVKKEDISFVKGSQNLPLKFLN